LPPRSGLVQTIKYTEIILYNPVVAKFPAKFFQLSKF
jgi:hypothetical protein